MGLTFLLDEDLSHRVAEGLRRRGVDAISVHDLKRAGSGISDEAQLEVAAQRGRVLVTYNRADFQAIDAQWRHEGRGHAGIMWCSYQTFLNRAIGDLVRALEIASRQFDSLAGLCVPLGHVDGG